MTEDLVTELAALETSFEALKDKLKFEDSTRSEIEYALGVFCSCIGWSMWILYWWECGLCATKGVSV